VGISVSTEYGRVSARQPQENYSTRVDTLERHSQIVKAELAELRQELMEVKKSVAAASSNQSSQLNRLRKIEEDVSYATRCAILVYESRTWKVLSRFGKLVAAIIAPFRNLQRPLKWKWRDAPTLVRAAVQPVDRVVINSDFPPPGKTTTLHGKALIGGWAACKSGIAKFEAYLAGRRLDVKYGVRRMDVRAILPDFTASEESGYFAAVEVADFPTGPHDLRLVAVSRSGHVEELVCPVVIIDRRTEYEIWRERHALDETALIGMKRQMLLFSYKPVISILCPVYNTPESFLRACVASVQSQIYPHWELILADDGSKNPELRSLIEEFAAEDPRIRACFLPENRGIARATNAALSCAHGEFVAFLDHDDEIATNALCEVVHELNLNPDWDVFYSDEDKIAADGRYVDAFFKPDWSPDLLLCVNYICHFLVCRRSILEAVGGLRTGFDGSQDHDLALRLNEHTGKIRRIPKVLYHWRIWPGSTASATNQKGTASNAGLRAVQDHLSRTAPGATASELGPSLYRVRYPIEGRPEVAIIIPTGGSPLLEHALQSVIANSTYPNYRIVVVDNSRTGVEETLRKFRNGNLSLTSVDCRGVPFNFSLLCNRAARSCDSPYLLFLNDDTSIITGDWIEALLEHAQREGVGAVGALLLFPDGKIQHGGVVMGVSGLAGHSFRLLDSSVDHYFRLSGVVRNCAAVTGACMMIRRDTFWDVGGFDEENLPTAFQDVDLCLKLHEKGYRMIYTPHARLYHYESATKTIVALQAEMDYMHKRWERYILDDPYYNPNLTRLGEGYTLPI
jgi:GT2 family glycosyltransferase